MILISSMIIKIILKILIRKKEKLKDLVQQIYVIKIRMNFYKTINKRMGSIEDVSNKRSTN